MATTPQERIHLELVGASTKNRDKALDLIDGQRKARDNFALRIDRRNQ